MPSLLLQVEGLSLASDHEVIVDNLSFTIDHGEIVALTGKSGSGKTSIGMALLGMLPNGIWITSGSIHWFGTKNNELIYPRDKEQWAKLRGTHIGFIQQDVYGIFDPVIQMGKQMTMIIRERTDRRSFDIEGELKLKMEEVGIKDIDRVWGSYPHQLSGGQLQRCQLCLSIVIQPSLIIADEPTSAIDKIIQIEILDLLAYVRHQYQMAILCITHEESVVKYLADRRIELGGSTKMLEGSPSNLMHQTDTKDPPLLEVIKIGYTHSFGGLVNKTGAKIQDVEFDLHDGHCLGIIGESGSGKSTIAQLLVGLLIPTEGQVKLKGKEIDFMARHDIRLLRSNIQLVMQDGRGSLHPNKSIRSLFDEVISQRKKVEKNLKIDTGEKLKEVGLPESILDRYENTLSGGECLRVCIARALLMQPAVLICDESTSSLDGPTIDGIIELLQSLMDKQKLALILISHDDRIIRLLADDILVLEGGRVVEKGKADLILNHPTNPVSRKIFASQATLSQKRSPL